MKQWIKDEKGSVMVLFALLLVFMIGLVGIVADAGLVYHQRAVLQNAADAAALAGAAQLPDMANASDSATQFGLLNGVHSNDAFQVTFPEEHQMAVRISRTVRLNFAPMVGYQSFNVSAQATARVIKGGTAFDYAIFSGDPNSPLIMNGGTQYVEGSGHSNHNTIINGSNLTMTGSMDMVGTFTGHGPKINIGTITEHSQNIPMPDFSSLIKSTATTVYNNSLNFNGGTLDVSGNIYAKGSVTFNGCHAQGIGCVMANDCVTVNGVSGGGMTYNSSDDAVCIYSQNGNIVINGGKNIVIYGLLYAPNGSIIFNGTKATIYGAVIAKNVIFNGIKADIHYDPHAVNSLPNVSVQLVQ
jgi:hypothetical protein